MWLGEVRRVRERLPVGRVRPLPPRPAKDFKPKLDQVVQFHHADGWWIGLLSAIRKKGEMLVERTS